MGALVFDGARGIKDLTGIIIKVLPRLAIPVPHSGKLRYQELL
jgi:hypothetical protein